jgi:AbrB family looped-hinge helix DNA binding protein
MNARIKLSTRGRIIIPAAMRAATGIKTGDSFKFRVEGKCVIIERVGEPMLAIENKSKPPSSPVS